MRTFSIILTVAFAVACGQPVSGPEDMSSDQSRMVADMRAAEVGLSDVGRRDLGGRDLGSTDLGSSDMGSAPDLPAPTDMAAAAGFGDISGPCGVLDDELTSAQTFFVANALDFGMDPYDDADLARLTDGGREIIADGNAGGNSLLSEVFSYEVLARCEGALLLKTETEITYQNAMGKITDLLVEIDGLKIGVSVTRALAFPFDDPYTEAQASTLLSGKLSDVQASSANVTLADAWTKQILHVIAYSPMHADSLRAAYDALDASVKADTVVLVTVTNGDDAPLY